MFFTALLPQFVTADGAVVSSVLLGLSAAAAALLGLSVYALLAAQAGAVLRRRWPGAILDAATGVVLLLFGGALLRRNASLAPAGSQAFVR